MATIKSKIIVNVIILLLTIVGIVVVNYADLCSLRKLQDEGAQRAKDAITLTEASGMADKFYSLVGEAVINRNMPEIEKGWTELRKELRDDAAAYEKIADTAKEKELALASHKAFEGLIQLFDTKLLPLLKADIGGARMEELLVIDREIDVLRNTAQKNLQEITGLITKESETADKEFDAQINAAIIKALIIGLIGILLQAGLATWLMRTIMKPVDSLRIMLMDISQGEGDLTKRLDDTTKDELAEISKYFNLFIEKLHRIISQISSTSAQVASASTQLQATAEHIATGAEEVAAQAGTVATAGEEMSATSSDIAQNCQMAADGAQQAAKASREGQQIALKTTEGIKYRIGQTGINAERISKLGERTDQIGAIVGTIEDIADQTNLLALNAAIEAARAGEQGRGFAVVADEVRALAERTTKATKEISDMIRAIQQETKVAVDAMKHGVETSQSAISDSISLETALKQILEKAEDVAMQVNQIATAAEEQTATTSEISNNMMQITEVVHQTSQGAHESATAAAQLNGNADELQRLVHQFKL